MILQALYDYRLRKGDSLAPDGFEWRNIPLLIELSPAGKITGIPTSEVEYLVPQVPKRANTIDPALLWDNAEYVLGIPDQKKVGVTGCGKISITREGYARRVPDKDRQPFRRRTQRCWRKGGARLL